MKWMKWQEMGDNSPPNCVLNEMNWTIWIESTGWNQLINLIELTDRKWEINRHRIAAAWHCVNPSALQKRRRRRRRRRMDATLRFHRRNRPTRPDVRRIYRRRKTTATPWRWRRTSGCFRIRKLRMSSLRGCVRPSAQILGSAHGPPLRWRGSVRMHPEVALPALPVRIMPILVPLQVII